MSQHRATPGSGSFHHQSPLKTVEAGMSKSRRQALNIRKLSAKDHTDQRKQALPQQKKSQKQRTKNVGRRFINGDGNGASNSSSHSTEHGQNRKRKVRQTQRLVRLVLPAQPNDIAKKGIVEDKASSRVDNSLVAGHRHIVFVNKSKRLM